MNWDHIEGKWMQLKGKVKEQWGDITDDDLDRVAGSRDQLAGYIQERYGIAKEEAEVANSQPFRVRITRIKREELRGPEGIISSRAAPSNPLRAVKFCESFDAPEMPPTSSISK